MAGRNVVEYEFQGNLLPLEKAFTKVSSLFRNYVKEAQKANESGKLTPDQKVIETEFENLKKRLNALKKKKVAGTLSKDEERETIKLYNRLLKLSERFKQQKDMILAKQTKDAERRAREEESKIDYSSVASQFKAGVQVEQLQDFMQAIPSLPPEVIADINAYIEAWKQASEAFKKGEISADELAAATEDLDNKTREYVGSLKTLEHEQKRASNGMEQLLSGIIAQISSFELWFRKIREGITLLGDYVESLNYLNVAIHNIDFSNFEKGADEASEAIESFTKRLEDARWALGLDATALNQTAATFLTFADAIGIADMTALTFAENITQLSIDLASLKNKDVVVMATALKSALAGNTRALMNFGLSVHDATLNEWLLEKGLNKTMNQMSEISQAMVRYANIIETLSSAQGDLARTIKSPSNQLKILKNQVNLLIQNLGSLFNTVIYPAIRILNQILIPLNAFMSSLTSITNNNYSSAVGDMTNATDDLTSSIENADNAAKGLTGLDEINQQVNTNATVTGIDPDIQGLIDGIGVYEGFSLETSKLTELMRSLGEAMAPIWAMFSNTNVLDAMIAVVEGLVGAFEPLKKLLDAIKTGFGNSPEWLQKILSIFVEIGGTLVSLATTIGIVTVALAVFKTLTESKLWGRFILNLQDMWDEFLTLGKTIYAAIARFITWIATMIKARIEAFKTAVANKGLGAALLDVAKGALMAVANLVKYIAKLVVTGAKAVFAAIKNLILSKSLWGVALGAIAAAGIAAGVVAAAVGIAVAIGDGIKRKNEATKGSIGLAKGGIVTGPTFALIGEGSYNEAVIPLGQSPQFQSMKEGIASEVINRINIPSNTGSNRPIILNINGKEMARALLPDLKQAMPQTGVKLAR